MVERTTHRGSGDGFRFNPTAEVPNNVGMVKPGQNVHLNLRTFLPHIDIKKVVLTHVERTDPTDYRAIAAHTGYKMQTHQ